MAVSKTRAALDFHLDKAIIIELDLSVLTSVIWVTRLEFVPFS